MVNCVSGVQKRNEEKLTLENVVITDELKQKINMSR
jgi:hypothetical protein